MRALLDTNIVICRESNSPERTDIGILFRWLDELHYEKCVHPETISEIRRHKDDKVVKAFEAKITSYKELRTTAPESEDIRRIREKHDRSENDRTDTSMLNEVFCSRVDVLITEDKKIHLKASELRISERIFTIDDFLEKVTAENPGFADYKVLSIRKEYIGNLNLEDSFFDSFRDDYIEFDDWLNEKSDEFAYVCKSENDDIVAFLYVKSEGKGENYGDIVPVFSPARRLKIGTMKVVSNGYKLGERFLKIVFDNALLHNVDEIYATLFGNSLAQKRLISLLEDWGFENHGVKTTDSGEESVLVRNFAPQVDKANPSLGYPYVSATSRKFIVSIYPEYHTELFPDSYLRTESPLDFVENRPNRNAIRKVYISRSFERGMESGDIVIFYRTAFEGRAFYTSVATTIGVIESVITDIPTELNFIEFCRKRSVFNDDELRKHWNYKPGNRPFIVKFLYVHTFPKRMNLEALIKAGVIESTSAAPRGFEQISDEQFSRLLEGSNADQRLIIN